MAQIFVSHSGKDKQLVDFFSNAFSLTKVKAILEKFEKILTGKITSQKISTDIERSNAVFVLLSKNVQKIPHTRDWVVWETGVAKNKDIWIFEPYKQIGKISIITPIVKHHVIFNTDEFHLAYIRKIIESYDNSHVLPTILMSSGVGAILGKSEGAAVGAMTGLMLSNKTKDRPIGVEVNCANCFSTYQIHIPDGMTKLRCPVCNKYIEIKA